MKGIVINEVNQGFDELISTAIDDYTIRNIDEHEMVLHMFQHKGINMGYDDLRLKNFEQGIEYYQHENESVILRSSGGRSIVADEGVLSMSLIYKSHESMDESYEFFKNFIMDALAPITKDIEEGEIVGACCPGKTDLSIKGKKFCGTAQRRVKDGVALVCYISINGDQKRRNRLVKGFYDACDSDEVKIDLDVMDSLSNLVNKEIKVDEVARLLIKQLGHHTDVVMHQNNTQNQVGFDEALAFTIKRNKVLTDI